MRQVERTDVGLLVKDRPAELERADGRITEVKGNQHGLYLTLCRLTDGAKTGFHIPIDELEATLQLLGIKSSRNLRGSDVTLYQDDNCLYGIARS